MKALVLEAYNQLVYREAPVPQCSGDEVLVEVRACGICGSDVHGIDGSTGRRIPPIIMGHEAAGVVVEVGADVAEWRPGDRVALDSMISCGRCGYCRAGMSNLCDRRRVLGVSCNEFRRDGAFAELVAVPPQILYRLPEGVPFEHAALVEPLSVAVHAVDRTPKRLGDTALVVGAGMIGLLVIQVLRAAGCGRVIAVDVNPSRRELAAALGADEVIAAGDGDPSQRVRDLTDGRGADVALECAGVPAAVHTAIDALRKGGSATLVGNLSPAAELPLQTVVTREIRLAGSCASAGEYAVCLDMIARKTVRVDPLLSAVAPLAEGAAWFARLRRGVEPLMKVVLQPSP